jgi:hypothetical protein
MSSVTVPSAAVTIGPSLSAAGMLIGQPFGSWLLGLET